MRYTPRQLLIMGLLLQFLSLPPLWGHQSDPATVLGRYSTRYALVLAVSVAAIVVYGIASRYHHWITSQLRRVPLWTLAALVMLAAGVWSLSLETHVRTYVMLNLFWLGVMLITVRDDAPASRQWGWWIVGAVALALFIPLFLTAFTVSGYHPDEAHYTDYASTFWATGQLYDSAWLETPYPIEPGWAWQLAAYGWLLETFGYTVYIGRIVNFVAYLICFAGLYAVATHLYGRQAGILTALTAYLSVAFIPEWDYSPNHLLTSVGAWALYGLVRARDAQAQHIRWGLYALVGLLVTLSLNVHAAGIVFAVAFTLYVGLNRLWQMWRQRSWQPLWDAVAFGGGALVGTIVYWFANVAIVGGLDVYLSVLGQWDGTRRSFWFFYTWESLFERVLIVFALAYLLMRRTEHDRFVLAIIGLTVFAAVLLDTQGYIWHFGPFYFIALGAFLAGALGTGWHQQVIAAGVALFMGLQVGATFIQWPTVAQFAQTGTVPVYLYNALKPILPQYVEADDVIYTTHQLIWIFPHTSQPNIVTYGAEYEGMQRFGVDTPDAVWEIVQPTVIIFVEGQMSFDVGMVEYMAQNPFEQCDQFDVQGTTITIYRASTCAR